MGPIVSFVAVTQSAQFVGALLLAAIPLGVGLSTAPAEPVAAQAVAGRPALSVTLPLVALPAQWSPVESMPVGA